MSILFQNTHCPGLRCGLAAAALLLGAAAAPAGVLLKLQYDNLPGMPVSSLTSDGSFPNAPTTYEVLNNGLQIGINLGDNFGTWTRGYLEAPQTGVYTFWIASDDDSELWLSSSENPAGKVKIAENVGAVGQHDYYAKPAQKSAPISLVQGQKYYFEMLHKENTGGDHCAVAWTLPDGSFQDPLPGTHLWPFPVELNYSTFPPLDKAPVILTDYLFMPVSTLSATTTGDDGRPLELSISVDASQPASVQWFSNGVAIPDAHLLTYRIPRLTLAHQGAVYSVTVSNSRGQASASTTLTVSPDMTPPGLVDAFNLGNPAADIAVVFSEPVDPGSATAVGNYSLDNGASIVSAVMSSNLNTVLLRTAGMSVGTRYTLTVRNVRDLASTPNLLSPNPSSVALEQSLHTWFRLDETSGRVALDASGYQRHGALTNGVLAGYSGKVLGALKFDGLDGYVRCQDSADDFSTNGMTIAFWANPVNNLQSWARFIDFGVGSFSDNILFARNGTSADLTFEVYNGTTSGGKVTAPGVLALNQWQHLAATIDTGGTVTLYKNGVAVATGYTSSPNAVMRTNNFIGHSNMAQDGYYQGRLDDLRIYTRALAPEAVAALAAGAAADDVDPAGAVVSVAAAVPTTALKGTPPAVFTVTRTGSTTAPLTVAYALGGSATNGVAYTNLSGSVVIPAGTNAAPIFIAPIDYAFQGLQQSVVLNLLASANYYIGDPDSATATIVNNDLNPAAVLAIADNALGSLPTTVDVWFAAPVANPSATSLANYSLVNAPGLAITSATLDSRNLRVVLGLSGPVPTNAVLNVSGVQDPGGNSAASQIPIRPCLSPFNLVANIYHSPDNNRAGCYALVTDGTINTTDGNYGFDTYGEKNRTQFAGLIYPYAVDIQALKVDLCKQFGDGGSWQSQPSVYVLTNAVDTDRSRPETDPNWVQVPVQLLSGGQFDVVGDANPSPITPIVFDLSRLPASQRRCYGWAVGGVLGDGNNTFISVSELRGYGTVAVTNTAVLLQQPENRTVTQGQRSTFVEVSRPTNTMAGVGMAYQWQRNGVDIPGATDVNYSIPPATLADNGASFSVRLSTVPAVNVLTSQVATLTVQARTAPPAVLAASLDTLSFNTSGAYTIEVWFDESIEASSAQNPANYSLNDPALSVSYVDVTTENSSGRRVLLTCYGTPTVANLKVTVTNVADNYGHTLATQTVPVLVQNWPVANVLANAYQQNRTGVCLPDSTNGVVTHATGDANVWATFEGTKNPNTSDFVGLLYTQPQVFGVLKVDLGHQFGDGGDWQLQPMVFLLTNNIDTNQDPPENNPNWMAVPATLLSDNVFNYAIDAPVNTDPPVNTPITFDLSHLPLTQRVGYGWAVGGVPGNGPAHFLSISELRAFGADAASLTNEAGAPQIVLDVPRSVAQPVGFPLTLSVVVAGSGPISYQWQRNGVNLSDDARVSGAHSRMLTVAHTTWADAGDYRVLISSAAGNTVSALARFAPVPVAFDSGAGWNKNGGAILTNNVLSLTDAGGQARSSFLSFPLYIGAFQATYTYQDIGGGGADGTVFVLQTAPAGPAALGGGGGAMGFSGISPSVGIEFNIYNTAGIAFRENGATGAPYDSTDPVNVASGNPIAVTVTYDGAALALALEDTVTGAAFSTNWMTDLPGTLGTSYAYVGFTGASGGVASRQQVSNFAFASGLPLTLQTGSANTVVLSWPGTLSGAVLQQTTDLGAPNWVNVTEPVTVVNGRNQVTVPSLTGSRFYRLLLP